jgi:hypothetical protein
MYSNKAFGASLLGVPVYWALRQFDPWRDSPPLTKGLRYGIRLVTTTLPFAALGVTLFQSAKAMGASPLGALLAAFSFGFGSIAFIHAGLFSGHGIAAAFAFFSFAGLMSQRRKETAGGGVMGFLLGLSAGIAGLADYTATWISVVLVAYALGSPIGRRMKTGFLLGGVLCALLLGLYNWKAFGSPISFSYAHQVTGSFAEGSRRGFLGISLPDWGAVLSLLGSPSRGFFFIMPVFLFSLEGIRRMVQSTLSRAEGEVIILIALGYVVMIGGFYGWHGGWTFGPRYFVPMLPFLALSLAFSQWKPLSFILAAGVSLLQVQIVAMSLPHCPEAIQNPLPELVVPAILEGYLAETWPGWLGLPYYSALLLYFGVCTLLFLGVYLLCVRDVLPPEEPPNRFQGVFSWAVLLWLVAIGLMSVMVRTDPPEQVATYRERLRFHRVHEQVIQRHVWELADRYRRAGGGWNPPAASGSGPHVIPSSR